MSIFTAAQPTGQVRDDRLPAQFFVYGFIATALVIASIVLRLSTGWIFFAILAPLGAYLFHVIRNRGRYGTNVADSVYYFGFGLTVITLAWSAIFHFGGAEHSEQDIHTVFTQFGAGLIATCVGLIARLWTLAIFEHEAKDKPGSAHAAELEQFARQLMETKNLVNDLGHAADKLRASMLASSDQMDDMMEAAIVRQERMHKESLEKFQVALAEAAADFQEATSTICDQLRAINLTEDAQGFHDAVKRIRASADVFARHSKTASESVGEAQASIQAMSAAATDATGKLAALQAGADSAAQCTAALDRVTGSLMVTERKLSEHAVQLGAHLESQQRRVAQLHDVQEQARQDAQSAVRQVADALANVAREVNQKVAGEAR